MAAFDWEEFLNLPEELIRRRGERGVGEAKRDQPSLLRRLFHAAGTFVRRHGVRLTFTSADHALVWDWLLRPEADRRWQWIGETGQRLR